MTTTAKTYTIARRYVDPSDAVILPTTVEVQLVRRLPGICIVGMRATKVRETAERVRSAIECSGFDFPRKRVVVMIEALDGTITHNRLGRIHEDVHDVAIAACILVASGQAPASILEGPALVGRLHLDGTITRPDSAARIDGEVSGAATLRGLVDAAR